MTRLELATLTLGRRLAEQPSGRRSRADSTEAIDQSIAPTGHLGRSMGVFGQKSSPSSQPKTETATLVAPIWYPRHGRRPRFERWANQHARFPWIGMLDAPGRRPSPSRCPSGSAPQPAHRLLGGAV